MTELTSYELAELAFGLVRDYDAKPLFENVGDLKRSMLNLYRHRNLTAGYLLTLMLNASEPNRQLANTLYDSVFLSLEERVGNGVFSGEEMFELLSYVSAMAEVGSKGPGGRLMLHDRTVVYVWFGLQWGREEGPSSEIVLIPDHLILVDELTKLHGLAPSKVNLRPSWRPVWMN